MKYRNIFISACLNLLLGTALAQESIVGQVSYPYLDKLVSIAKDKYPKRKVFIKNIDIAKTNVSKAKLSWFDFLNTSYTYNPSNYINILNPTFFVGYQFGFSVNIGTLLQKPGTIRNAKSELEIAHLQTEEYDLNLEREVKTRYFTYLQSIALLKFATQTVLDAENTLKSLRHKFDRGEETFENYNKAVIDHSNQVQEKIKYEASFFIAKSNLEELLGQKMEDIK